MITSLSGTLPLADGNAIPAIGYGTWQVADGERAVAAVKAAIAAGYRHIDTAAAYGNEAAVGRAIAEALEDNGLVREDLFVTTKLWNSRRGHDEALRAFDESARLLGLDHVDLYLIHWPASSRQHPEDWAEVNAATWRAFEELKAEGRARSIGLSNFMPRHLQALLAVAHEQPVVNQLELHPGFGQWQAAEASRQAGLVVEAWSPLGSGAVLGDPALTAVAAEVGRTPAQVALRWLLQQDVVVLPKSVTPERIVANTELFDFELSDEQMAAVAAIDDGAEHHDPDQVTF
ncbi:MULTISPECIES: aldo/keto reductase [unclassified Actinomyces]|uniref:aldo/keto reductase n=1 Tax=unclassified Actinomyces TaxID=2609248 RepID=UPI0020181F9E|nr:MULTISPECIES: aldo/keto reductase [unclassified Actinomyces]MCL3777646.1 aldo/keto reductase [Actinomyces sp. AC-20-1]MCL3790029.1 aldo/keto reductase [Actinomyces sp. 187325]MCL3792426.1 aldo/keto reductase [Actinomyces sp. 186855]MCL3794829.1 aldo/keto reductase [Actinomyces sp. 217892]